MPEPMVLDLLLPLGYDALTITGGDVQMIREYITTLHRECSELDEALEDAVAQRVEAELRLAEAERRLNWTQGQVDMIQREGAGWYVIYDDAVYATYGEAIDAAMQNETDNTTTTQETDPCA